MVFSINEYLGVIYGYSVLIGLLLSIYFIPRYSEEYKGIDFKKSKYPKAIYIFVALLLLFYFVFVPFLFYKLITHKDLLEELLYKYSEVDYKYKGNSMFPGNGGNRTNVDNKVAHRVIITGDATTSTSEEGKSLVQTTSTDSAYTSATNSYSIRNTIITDTEISMNNKPIAENALAFNFTNLDESRNRIKPFIDKKTALAELKTDRESNPLKISKDKKVP